MKVHILGTRGYPHIYSGYETFVAELSAGLVARGHEVVVYCHRGLFTDRPKYVNGVRLVYVPCVESKTLSQFTHSFLSTIHVAFQKTHVVFYVNSANGPFGLVTRLFGKHSAINVDGLEWLRPKWKGLGARYFHLASFLATRLFDVVITDSVKMSEIYQREFNSVSETITYGANCAHSTKSKLIERFGLTPRDYYLVVGRLVPDNNADLIVRAFKQSALRRKLVVLGDVSYRDRYAMTVKAMADDRIMFPGYVRDQELLTELYCNAYAYIHGHEFGGTNPSLLKALANGCCVLALDTPFSREVLLGEMHGFYFKKDDRELVRLLASLDSDGRAVEEKRTIARNRIAEAYTWEQIVDKYESLFCRMMERGSKPGKAVEVTGSF
jgi:glycosyltransferase involved in cell wall biosynthesis